MTFEMSLRLAFSCTHVYQVSSSNALLRILNGRSWLPARWALTSSIPEGLRLPSFNFGDMPQLATLLWKVITITSINFPFVGDVNPRVSQAAADQCLKLVHSQVSNIPGQVNYYDLN